jgi:cytochrome c5
VSSRTARAIQRNPVSKTKQNETNKQTKPKQQQQQQTKTKKLGNIVIKGVCNRCHGLGIPAAPIDTGEQVFNSM